MQTETSVLTHVSDRANQPGYIFDALRPFGDWNALQNIGTFDKNMVIITIAHAALMSATMQPMGFMDGAYTVLSSFGGLREVSDSTVQQMRHMSMKLYLAILAQARTKPCPNCSTPLERTDFPVMAMLSDDGEFRFVCDRTCQLSLLRTHGLAD